MLALRCPVSTGDWCSQPPILILSLAYQLCRARPVPVPLQGLIFPLCTFSDLTGPNLGVLTVKYSQTPPHLSKQEATGS